MTAEQARDSLKSASEKRKAPARCAPIADPKQRKITDITGDRFLKEFILDVQTHFKPTETFQYTNFYSHNPPGVTKGFFKGEAF